MTHFLDALAVLAALYFGRDALNTAIANARIPYGDVGYRPQTLIALALVMAWAWARIAQ